jgi:hypothetical protein
MPLPRHNRWRRKRRQDELGALAVGLGKTFRQYVV